MFTFGEEDKKKNTHSLDLAAFRFGSVSISFRIASPCDVEVIGKCAILPHFIDYES